MIDVNVSGNRNGPSACALISDKFEGRRADRSRDNQRSRLRGRSRITGRVARDFRDRRTEEMSQAPLIATYDRMPENDPRDFVILEVHDFSKKKKKS